MKDALYKKRRNLFIKREKFESRLIRYLEDLISYMDRTGKPLPEYVFYDFSIIEEDTGDAIFGRYSNFADELFKNMKDASDDTLDKFDAILDDFHHELDEYEKDFNRATSTNH